MSYFTRTKKTKRARGSTVRYPKKGKARMASRKGRFKKK